MNKLYECFDSDLKSKMDRLLNNIELVGELVKIKGLENNQVYLDWLDKLNKFSVQ